MGRGRSGEPVVEELSRVWCVRLPTRSGIWAAIVAPVGSVLHFVPVPADCEGQKRTDLGGIAGWNESRPERRPMPGSRSPLRADHPLQELFDHCGAVQTGPIRALPTAAPLAARGWGPTQRRNRCQRSPNHSPNVGTSVMPAQAIATSGTAAIAPLPSPRRMSRSSSGRLPSRSSRRRWPGLGRAVADDAVVERGRLDHHERQHRRGDDVAVEHDGQRAVAGGDDRGGDRHQLGAADLAQHLDRVGDAGDPAHGLLHGGALAGQAGVVDAGAAADPRRRLTAGERGGDRRRRRGVADAHLADDEQVAVEAVDGGDRHVDDLVEPLRRRAPPRSGCRRSACRCRRRRRRRSRRRGGRRR